MPDPCSILGKISQSWLWSSSSPPVTSFTITLSMLFLLLCGKMAERKRVYTVILFCVRTIWPRLKFPLECCQSFCKHFFPPPPTFLSLSLSFSPSLSLLTSDRRGRPDRYSDSMVSDPLLNSCSSCSSILPGATIFRLGFCLVWPLCSPLWFQCGDDKTIYSWSLSNTWSCTYFSCRVASRLVLVSWVSLPTKWP